MLQKFLLTGLHKDRDLSLRAKELHDMFLYRYGYTFRHPGLIAVALIDPFLLNCPSLDSEAGRTGVNKVKRRTISNLPLAELGDTVAGSLCRGIVLKKRPRTSGPERGRLETALVSNEYFRRVYLHAWARPPVVFRYDFSARKLVPQRLEKGTIFPVEAAKTIGTVVEALLGGVYLDSLDFARVFAFAESALYSDECVAFSMPELTVGAENPIKELQLIADEQLLPRPLYYLVNKKGEKILLPSRSEVSKTSKVAEIESSSSSRNAALRSMMTPSSVALSNEGVDGDAKVNFHSSAYLVRVEIGDIVVRSRPAGSIHEAKLGAAAKALYRLMPRHRRRWMPCRKF